MGDLSCAAHLSSTTNGGHRSLCTHTHTQTQTYQHTHTYTHYAYTHNVTIFFLFVCVCVCVYRVELGAAEPLALRLVVWIRENSFLGVTCGEKLNESKVLLLKPSADHSLLQIR